MGKSQIILRFLSILLNLLPIFLFFHPGSPRIRPDAIRGVATFYAPNVMDRVVKNRISWGQLPEDIVGPFVAVRDCDKIGRKAWIRWEARGTLEGPFIVADCANPADWSYLSRIRFAVDVEWSIAERHEMLGPVPVTVFVE